LLNNAARAAVTAMRDGKAPATIVASGKGPY